MTTPDYKGFVQAIFSEGIDSWDGDDLQSLGVDHGVLRPEHRTIPCSDVCPCAEVCDRGDEVTCYRFVWVDEPETSENP